MTLKWTAVLVGGAVLSAAPSCESEARAWRNSAKSPDRAALERCATRLNTTAAGAAARLTMAVAAIEAQRYTEAQPILQRLRGPLLGRIDDYISFFNASALAGLDRHGEAIMALEPVWRQQPVSAVAGRAALLAAKSYMALGRPADAGQILEKFDTHAAQPQGDFAAAEAWLAAGNRAKAAVFFSRVYFRYPQSAEAANVGPEWRAAATPADYLLRAERSGPAQASAIRAELQTASAAWSAEDRELAQVKGWELSFRARRWAEARQGLAALTLNSPRADAERLWLLYQTARRLDLAADRMAAFDRLGRHHKGSPRYLEALLAEGYRSLNENEYQTYEPIYKACVANFERDAKAPFCHWKLVWSSYLRRRPDAEALLWEHLRRFPHSEKANSALYFLGRLAEKRGDLGAARFFYETTRAQFTNTYYALIAAERLNDPGIRSAPRPADQDTWEKSLRWPPRWAFTAAEAAAARARRERASLLAMAGLDNYAEFELRMGAREEKVPIVLAMDLADHMAKIGQADKGLRYIKGLLPGYLFFPWEAAGERFWRLAFPMPFQDDVEKYAREHDVDPYVVAGLIRQESEFNPKVVSHANAYGLTQILPSTGRDLSRRVGLRAFHPSMLFDPAVNLRLGTYYLKILLKSFGGRWEDVLAAYNGGGSRVTKWRKFGTFTEQAEFIETIPFDETRDYVQSVLRNANVYRRLYEGKVASVHSSNEPPAKPRAAIGKKPIPKRQNR
ncbi:MAG: transglycosylase SLT domain-containing protein [Bryobacterales bacterium]|nr:transglycosylase SLT domain-containing protein [Bryobacterales bacterium]